MIYHRVITGWSSFCLLSRSLLPMQRTREWSYHHLDTSNILILKISWNADETNNLWYLKVGHCFKFWTQVHLSICFLGFHVKTKPFPPSFPLLFHDKYFHNTQLSFGNSRGKTFTIRPSSCLTKYLMFGQKLLSKNHQFPPGSYLRRLSPPASHWHTCR